MTQPPGLLRPAFPGDTGAADPLLVAALRAASQSDAARRRALRLLATARVFVPVAARRVAVTTGLEGQEGQEAYDGGPDGQHAEMALVTISGRDGRRAVPAFTSADGLLAWHNELRPVPVEGARAAQTAVDDGGAAVLVDPGQPTELVVTGAELDRLAAVWTVGTSGRTTEERDLG